VMASFESILAEIQWDCAWEHIPSDKISALARVCGPAEVDHLIRELDALDDTDLLIAAQRRLNFLVDRIGDGTVVFHPWRLA
jgi:hypothetical protein